VQSIQELSNVSLRARTLNLIQVKKELCNRIAAVMSALGQKQTLDRRPLMSAIPPKADIVHGGGNVRFVPKADIADIACGQRVAVTTNCGASAR
jgi:hypothetical protein